jgi:hypothetical protein
MKAKIPLNWRLLFAKVRLLVDPSFRNSTALEEGYQIVKGLNDLNLLRLFVNRVVEVMTYQISTVEVSDTPEVIIRKGTGNFLTQKIFTSIFSGDYLCRSYIAAHLSHSRLWFPLSKEMRLEAKKLGISTSAFMCTFLWFVFKLKRIFGVVLREILKPKRVLNVGRRESSDVYVLDTGLDKSNNQHTQVLIRFANWFAHMPDSVKKQFMSTSSLSAETIICSSDSVKMHEFKESILLRMMISLSAINHELTPFGSFRRVIQSAIHRMCSRSFRNSLGEFENTSSLFLVPSNAGIARPVWTYIFQYLGSDFAFIELSSGLDPNPFKGDLLNFGGLNTWEFVYSPSRINLPLSNGSLDSSTNSWTRIAEWGSPMRSPLQNSFVYSKQISVFDLEPQRNWYGISTLNDMGYDKAGVVSHFLRTIVEQASILDIVVLHKPKRKIGEARLSEYSSLILDLAKEYPSNYIVIPEETSPTEVICRTIGTISMPCTSTAMMAHDLRVPSIYFDSTCLMDPRDSATGGIKVIQNSSEMANWLRNL